MFGIWCEVTGGVTGYRAAWMKDDGKRATFEAREEAQAEADRQMVRSNGPHARARFTYTARKIDD